MLIENKKHKNVILLTLLATVIIFLFEVIPKYSDLVTIVFKLIEQNSEIERIAENEKELMELNLQNQLLKSRIYSTVSDYKENKNLSAVISHLDSLAKESHIKNLAIKPGQMIKENHLWLQPIEVSLNSGYENIYNYIRFLENSSRVIKIKGLYFKPEKPLKPELDLKANIEVYLNL
jgi:Tfp pilus assembly protein PilO